MQIFNPVAIVKALLAEKLKSVRIAVDLTAGNGHDTLFLAENTPEHAVIFAFDLQESAIKSTEELLIKHNLRHKAKLYCADHALVRDYLPKEAGIDAAMFNLGYLPGENHELVTKTASTMLAVNEVMDALNEGGIISVITYPGHDEGQQEEAEINKFFAALPNKSFSIIRAEMLNHVNNPPIVYLLEKVKKR